MKTAIFCLLILMAANLARADGGYIPERAYPMMPSIPAQQAIIVHRNGQETLIVESTFQTRSPQVAWILPLPAEPTTLELGDSGMITSANMAMRPAITHDIPMVSRVPFLAMLAVFVFALIRHFSPDRNTRHSRYVLALAVVALLGFLSAILLPSLGTAGVRDSMATSLTVLSATRLEDYDATVLRAAEPAAISRWLTEHGLQPLPVNAEAIIKHYIADGWCFVVATLRGEGLTTQVPRPLMATFPAEKPVFPMKFTAIADTPTRVDLCIIAESQAAAPGFHCVAADRFSEVPGWESNGRGSGPYFAGDQTGLRIGSPDVVTRMWPGCVVTRLSAKLKPAAMGTDVVLSQQELRSIRDHFFTAKSRGQIMLGMVFAGLAIWVISVVWFRIPTWSTRFYPAAILLAGLIVLWLVLPTIPVTSGRGQFMFPTTAHGRFAMALDKAMQSGEFPAEPTAAQIAEIPRILIEQGLLSPTWDLNRLTGQPLIRQRSPGNFDVRWLDGKGYFCMYDADGRELRREIPQLRPLPAPIVAPEATSPPGSTGDSPNPRK